ncbi:MAG: transcriptional regulator [Acidobacteria bacterium]|nr:MAG: transcriptional regulator [Acidobacteriota bacterium]MCE7959384.1 transcriptional regulator [Acidobacteria bacterium ACB2]
MKPVKRVEIVVEALLLPRVTELVEAAGIRGYTVIRNAGGKGSHGERHEDELVDLHRNAYLVVACEPEQVEPFLASLRPLLTRFSGMCLVSDALWVRH